jgi:hypothetical protein
LGERHGEYAEVDRAFDTFPIVRVADQLLDYLSPDAVEADLARLAEQDAILEYVQTTVAHRVPERPELDVPTFGDFHDAVRVVRDVVDSYYLLLTHRTVLTYEPIPQYDLFEPFRAAWIPNPEAFDLSSRRVTACGIATSGTTPRTVPDLIRAHGIVRLSL